LDQKENLGIPGVLDFLGLPAKADSTR